MSTYRGSQATAHASIEAAPGRRSAKRLTNKPSEKARLTAQRINTFVSSPTSDTVPNCNAVIGTVSAIVLSLMLNEVRRTGYRRVIQTVVYMPYFLSWVILGSIFTSMLSNDGMINNLIVAMGGQPIFFLGDNGWFRFILILTDVWKGVGFGTVVYLAAITAIDPTLYEAAVMDGAGRIRQTWHVTIPGMMPIIVLMAMLNLGNLMNAGFDQIFNMYNPLVMDSSDIIDTLVYRLGMVSAKFSLATAVGLLKSVITMILMSVSYFLAYKFADYRVF